MTPKLTYHTNDWGNQNCVHAEIEIGGQRLTISVNEIGQITLTTDCQFVSRNDLNSLNQVKLQMQSYLWESKD